LYLNFQNFFYSYKDNVDRKAFGSVSVKKIGHGEN
jgi:hypothetical protein